MMARTCGAVLALAVAMVPAIACAAPPIGPKPAGSPANWASDLDYPPGAVRDHKTGNAEFKLTVAATGMPTACQITKSSGDSRLDKTTCELMMDRARFNPARNEQGMAVEGVFASAVHWQLPEGLETDIAPPLAPVATVISFDVETDGSLTHCHVDHVEGTIPDAVRAAMPCNKGRFFHPANGRNGKPVRRHVVQSSSLTVTEIP